MKKVAVPLTVPCVVLSVSVKFTLVMKTLHPQITMLVVCTPGLVRRVQLPSEVVLV